MTSSSAKKTVTVGFERKTWVALKVDLVLQKRDYCVPIGAENRILKSFSLCMPTPYNQTCCRKRNTTVLWSRFMSTMYNDWRNGDVESCVRSDQAFYYRTASILNVTAWVIYPV